MSKRRIAKIALGAILFVWAEGVLLGASEGVEKSQWIELGTIPNIIMSAVIAFS